MQNYRKIGFSKVGGIYIGELEPLKLHKHKAITIALSFKNEFEFENEKQKIKTLGVISQPNTYRKYICNPNNLVAFVHIEPFLSAGLPLLNKNNSFQELFPEQMEKIVHILNQWYKEEGNSEKLTETAIQDIAKQIASDAPEQVIDCRIKKSIDLIWSLERITLGELAAINHISTYRFSHLFKQETGVSFKEYLLHRKLVKAMQAILVNKENLTSSAYTGGFSDQSHFNRTYLNAFGVTPNKSIK